MEGQQLPEAQVSGADQDSDLSVETQQDDGVEQSQPGAQQAFAMAEDAVALGEGLLADEREGYRERHETFLILVSEARMRLSDMKALVKVKFFLAAAYKPDIQAWCPLHQS